MKAILILVLVAAVLLCGCQRSGQPALVPKETVDPPSMPETLPVDPDGQLLCLAGSQQEAEEVAALYNIELVSYADGLAVYHTEEDPRDVISRGEKNGWIELSLNYLANLY